MADPVYDENRNPDQMNPAELRDLEQKYSTKQDQKEDNAIEDGANPEDQPRQGKGRKLRQRSQDQDAADESNFNSGLSDAGQNARSSDRANGQSLYRKGWKKDKGFFKTLRRRRGLLIGVGVGGTLMIATLLAFLSFLNVFKLDDIMTNIDAKTFSRLNGNLDNRSTKYIQAYMELRLADICNDPNSCNPNLTSVDDPDNLIFRANKVNRGNPIFNWYHTMRTSNFEEQVFNKQGIYFTSVAYRDGNQIKFRPAKITYSGQDFNGRPISAPDAADAREALLSGDWATVNKDDFIGKYLSDVDTFNNDKEARSAIKKSVNDNTHFFQVFERRQLRKDIQNMTGVRSWSFFEPLTNKFDEKKINIRNKIISAAVPESTLSGKFIRCLFGISDCSNTGDPEDPQDQASNDLNGEDSNPDDNGRASSDPVADPELANLGPAVDLVKKINAQIISKATPILSTLNIVSTLDTLAKVDSNISNGSLSKTIAVARGVQAMGLYQVFETSRDQIKSGQANPDEVKAFMGVIGSAGASDGWAKVVDGHGDPSQITNTTASKEYCSEQHQAALQADVVQANKEYAYQCPDQQIGGGSNAASLESSYDNGIGGIIHPLATKYEALRGSFFGKFIDFANSIVGAITSIIPAAVNQILSVTGLQGNIQNAMQYVMGKLIAFMGAGPIMTGNESGGQYMNWLVQGAAYSAEAAARAAGAAATTASSLAASQNSLALYQQQQQSQESIAGRYLSTSNPDSPLSKSLLAISEFKFSSSGSKLFNIGSIFKTIGSGLASPFSHAALAASDNGYGGAQFAGIQTYDFPPECYNLDPITAQPMTGTNAITIFNKYGINASNVAPDDLAKLQTWDTESNSQDFFATVYDIINKAGHTNDADAIAEQIYNCNLLDNSVRGSIGNLYGYTSDNGLN